MDIMSNCNSEGVAEFVRLLYEIEDFIAEMTPYEQRFIEDNRERVNNCGDRAIITETQLDFARQLYSKYL